MTGGIRHKDTKRGYIRTRDEIGVGIKWSAKNLGSPRYRFLTLTICQAKRNRAYNREK